MKDNELTDTTIKRLVTTLIVVLGILAISFTLNCVQYRNAELMDDFRHGQNIQFDATLQMYKNNAARYDSTIVAIRDQIKVDSAISSNTIAGLKSRIRRLVTSANIDPPTPDEQALCERIIVSSFRKDTVIATQDSLIQHLETRATELVNDFGLLLNAKDSIIANDRELTALWKAEAEKVAAAYWKLERRANKRLSVGPYVGVGYPGGLQVGVGLQYSLIKIR